MKTVHFATPFTALLAVLALALVAVPAQAGEVMSDTALAIASPAAPGTNPGELTLEDLAALVAPSPREATGCSASTRCTDGTVISCSGTSTCFSAPTCFVYCDGFSYTCTSTWAC